MKERMSLENPSPGYALIKQAPHHHHHPPPKKKKIDGDKNQGPGAKDTGGELRENGGGRDCNVSDTERSVVRGVL